MKTNKKAVLGFAVAIVFSLAFMQGNTIKSTKQDVSLQQVGGVAAYVGGSMEAGGGQSVASYISNAAIATGAGMVTYGVAAGAGTFSNPVGWGYWGATAAVFL